MNFSDEQILYASGRDVVMIPAIDKMDADLIAVLTTIVFILMSMLLATLFLNVIIRVDIKILLAAVIALVYVYFLSVKPIIFLLFRSKRVVFEFNPENFICDGKAIKWADIRGIDYREYLSGRRRYKHKGYHITIYCEHLTKEKLIMDILKKELVKTGVKEKYSIVITKGILLKMKSIETVRLIADKFYQYYGASNCLMIRRQIFSYDYDYKVESVPKDFVEENKPQIPDDSIQMPKLIR